MLGYYLVKDYGFSESQDDELVWRKGSVIIEQISYGSWNIRTDMGWYRGMLEYQIVNILESINNRKVYESI